MSREKEASRPGAIRDRAGAGCVWGLGGFAVLMRRPGRYDPEFDAKARGVSRPAYLRLVAATFVTVVPTATSVVLLPITLLSPKLW